MQQLLNIKDPLGLLRWTVKDQVDWSLQLLLVEELIVDHMYMD